MVVDHQAHWYPPAYFDSILGRAGRYPRASRAASGNYRFELEEGGWEAELGPAFFDLDTQLADMDEHGIDYALVSPNMVGELFSVSVEEARESLMLINGELAEAQRRHPDRIAGLAMLPMQDPDAAIEVLDHAIVELGLRGVCLLSNIGGQPITGPHLLPVYQRIDALGVPIVLHPATHSMVHDRNLVFPIEGGAGWPFDTTAATLSLIFSGTLDACERLRVVQPHLGGMLPYILGRLEQMLAQQGRIEDMIKQSPGRTRHPLRTYLRERIYADTVNFTPGAIALAIDAYGIEHIVLGTDYPWVERAESPSFLREHEDADVLEQILDRNAVTGPELQVSE